MSFFDDQEWQNRRQHGRNRRFFGWSLMALFSAGLLVGAYLPTPYVIEQPGPTFNVLGESDGKQVISIEGAQNYKTAGNLDLLTVSLVGNREETPNWFELAAAYLDPAKIIIPLDEAFPPEQTQEQYEAESSAMMEESQQDAIAAALTTQGYQIPSHIYISEVTKGGASSNKLIAADFITSVNGIAVAEIEKLRAVVDTYDGKNPLKVEVKRGSKVLAEEITPVKDATGAYRLGILVGYKYDFPIKVNLQLSDVGGPSGGMMFALGIIDKLTPGYLNGGKYVAGTGTITASGLVGPIGGIRQKLYGAYDQGAKYFLAPAENCDEVVGNIPGDLKVFSVAKLTDALNVLSKVSAGADLSKLPTCKTK